MPAAPEVFPAFWNMDEPAPAKEKLLFSDFCPKAKPPPVLVASDAKEDGSCPGDPVPKMELPDVVAAAAPPKIEVVADA